MRSVAKGNYIKGKGGIKHAIAHVRYLQMRGGDDRDQAVGRKRMFISAIHGGISGSEVNERLRKQDEDGVVIHRIVSLSRHSGRKHECLHSRRHVRT
jgi:hypothetical protein